MAADGWLIDGSDSLWCGEDATAVDACAYLAAAAADARPVEPCAYCGGTGRRGLFGPSGFGVFSSACVCRVEKLAEAEVQAEAGNDHVDDARLILARSLGRLSTSRDDAASTREVVLAAVRTHGYAICYASEELRGDREVVLSALEHHGCLLQYTSEALKADKEVVLAAVMQNGLALQFADASLRADIEVVLIAVSGSGHALRFANEDLKFNEEVCATAVAFCPFLLREAWFPEQMRGSRMVALAAVVELGAALEHTSEGLRSDRQVVLTAVANDGRALQFASEELRADRELTLMAVASCGIAIQFVTPILRADDEVAATAVAEDARALEFVTSQRVCIAAVTADWQLLSETWFPKAMRADRDVMLAALRQSEEAWQYAAESLRSDREVLVLGMALLRQHQGPTFYGLPALAAAAAVPSTPSTPSGKKTVAPKAKAKGNGQMARDMTQDG